MALLNKICFSAAIILGSLLCVDGVWKTKNYHIGQLVLHESEICLVVKAVKKEYNDNVPYSLYKIGGEVINNLRQKDITPAWDTIYDRGDHGSKFYSMSKKEFCINIKEKDRIKYKNTRRNSKTREGTMIKSKETYEFNLEDDVEKYAVDALAEPPTYVVDMKDFRVPLNFLLLSVLGFPDSEVYEKFDKTDFVKDLGEKISLHQYLYDTEGSDAAIKQRVDAVKAAEKELEDHNNKDSSSSEDERERLERDIATAKNNLKEYKVKLDQLKKLHGVAPDCPDNAQQRTQPNASPQNSSPVSPPAAPQSVPGATPPGATPPASTDGENTEKGPWYEQLSNIVMLFFAVILGSGILKMCSSPSRGYDDYGNGGNMPLSSLSSVCDCGGTSICVALVSLIVLSLGCGGVLAYNRGILPMKPDGFQNVDSISVSKPARKTRSSNTTQQMNQVTNREVDLVSNEGIPVWVWVLLAVVVVLLLCCIGVVFVYSGSDSDSVERDIEEGFQ